MTTRRLKTQFYFLLTTLFLVTITNAYAQNPRVEDIFDGKTLQGWKQLTGSATYDVVDGMIVGTTVSGSPNSFLATEKEYGDFILELEVKIEGGKNNSGIMTRSHFDANGNNGAGRVYGRQVEVDPTDRKWSGGIYDEARRGWLYPLDLNEAARAAFDVDKFNHIRIECIGDETKTWVNGIPTAHVIDTVDRQGFIALQVHSIAKDHQPGEKVYFKNIKLKTDNLKPKDFPSNIKIVNLKDEEPK
ncbi:3-keto-disaccharide hydrolase [Albibacterium profundi]|uniref:DUF1080 domain-containing protein n=1 Tax=Albibacterium profundi TaxID=3134906 RepID=A0ABV5CHJ7_9SPHI